jgi:hypothetical protein
MRNYYPEYGYQDFTKDFLDQLRKTKEKKYWTQHRV